MDSRHHRSCTTSDTTSSISFACGWFGSFRSGTPFTPWSRRVNGDRLPDSGIRLRSKEYQRPGTRFCDDLVTRNWIERRPRCLSSQVGYWRRGAAARAHGYQRVDVHFVQSLKLRMPQRATLSSSSSRNPSAAQHAGSRIAGIFVDGAKRRFPSIPTICKRIR